MLGSVRSHRVLVVSLMVLLIVGLLPSAASAAGTFSDDDGSVHEANIEYIFALGVTTGCDTGLYCPDDLVTRAQMATFFVRMFGYPASAVNAFTDDDGNFHEANINAFAAAGVTAGCATGKYCPDDFVTRGQMARFFENALDLTPFTTVIFDDVSGIFHGSINAIYGVGITTGCTDTSYCPGGFVTRGQMASFLARAHKLGAKRAPAVSITSPAHLTNVATAFDSGTGLFGAEVTFTSVYSDPNGGTPVFIWNSSTDGALGAGAGITSDLFIPFGTDSDQPTITVRATDADGLFTEDAIQLKLFIPSP